MMRERASELTNGRLDVQVFPSAQLGGSREMVEGMQVGTAEMAMPTAAVASRVIKELEVLDLPFLFRISRISTATSTARAVPRCGRPR